MVFCLWNNFIISYSGIHFLLVIKKKESGVLERFRRHHCRGFHQIDRIILATEGKSFECNFMFCHLSKSINLYDTSFPWDPLLDAVLPISNPRSNVWSPAGCCPLCGGSRGVGWVGWDGRWTAMDGKKVEEDVRGLRLNYSCPLLVSTLGSVAGPLLSYQAKKKSLTYLRSFPIAKYVQIFYLKGMGEAKQQEHSSPSSSLYHGEYSTTETAKLPALVGILLPGSVAVG